jgi:hypothetical protein
MELENSVKRLSININPPPARCTDFIFYTLGRECYSNASEFYNYILSVDDPANDFYKYILPVEDSACEFYIYILPIEDPVSEFC